MNTQILSKNIQVILFDLDDTLINSEQIYGAIYQKLSLDLPLFMVARKAVKAELPPLHVAARNRLLYFKKYLEMKSQFTVEKLMCLNNDYEKLLQNLIESNLKETQHQMVLKTLASHFRLGIVTNENLRTQMLKMQKIDPNNEFFSFILTSEEMGVEKPHHIIVDKALSLAQVNPGHILMIGDSITNDLIPFQQRGCSVVGTRQFRKESEKTTTHGIVWIDQLSDMERVLGINTCTGAEVLAAGKLNTSE